MLNWLIVQRQRDISPGVFYVSKSYFCYSTSLHFEMQPQRDLGPALNEQLTFQLAKQMCKSLHYRASRIFPTCLP